MKNSILKTVIAILSLTTSIIVLYLIFTQPENEEALENKPEPSTIPSSVPSPNIEPLEETEIESTNTISPMPSPTSKPTIVSSPRPNRERQRDRSELEEEDDD